MMLYSILYYIKGRVVSSYQNFTKGPRTSFASGCSHSTTDSHHSSGYARMYLREGGGDGWPFSSNGRQIGILFSFSHFITIISSRELHINFALQILFSSGKWYNSRVLNFGSINFVMGLELLLSSSCYVWTQNGCWQPCQTWLQECLPKH